MRPIALAAALAILLCSPAAAVNVDPDPDSAGVILENIVEITPRGPAGEETDSSHAAPSPQTCHWVGPTRVCDGIATDVVGIAAGDDARSLPAEVRRAVEEVGLPALTVQIQPGGQTLVNAPTIFYTDAPVFTHSTVLLGQSVDITATPARFTWHHGDGSSQTTTSAGGPYPAMDVTHTYLSVAAGLQPRVDVAYRVTFRVNGGASQSLDQTITASGPAVSLDVAEARPVIVAP